MNFGLIYLMIFHKNWVLLFQIYLNCVEIFRLFSMMAMLYIIPKYFRCSVCASFRESMSYKSIFKLDGDNDETTFFVIFLRRGIDTEFIFISEFSSSQKSTLDVEDLSEDQINNSGDK